MSGWEQLLCFWGGGQEQAAVLKCTFWENPNVTTHSYQGVGCDRHIQQCEVWTVAGSRLGTATYSLYCIILYCTVLYYIILYCTAMYSYTAEEEGDSEEEDKDSSSTLVDEVGTVWCCYNVSVPHPRRCGYNFVRLQCWLLTDIHAYRIRCQLDLMHIQFIVGIKFDERHNP